MYVISHAPPPPDGRMSSKRIRLWAVANYGFESAQAKLGSEQDERMSSRLEKGSSQAA